MILIKFSLDTIDDAAREFLRKVVNRKHFAIYGSMGAGKTTFIKALCKALGVSRTVSSPTFAIVNEYNADNNETVYHFDFYRINKPEEVFDFGCEEYFASGNYCFVEWAEKAEMALPQDVCRAYLEVLDDGGRELRIES